MMSLPLLFLSRRSALWAAALVSVSVLAGCQGGPGQVSAPDVPIAFESIEGPPEEMRTRLAGFLASEAAIRQMRLVGTGSQARYRVRGYLTASTAEGGRLDYVWDVFDGTALRTQRVAGASAARAVTADGPQAWDGVDEAALRAVARRSLDGIAVFLVASETSRPAPDDGAAAASAPATE